MKKIIPAILAVVFITFPFLIHYGLHYLSPSIFSCLLLLMFIPRILLTPSKNIISKMTMGGIVILYCIAIAWFDKHILLFYYPVLMNLFVAMFFLLSLFTEQSLIEEFAQLSGKKYPSEAKGYMRTLTKIWAFFLSLNAIVAAYTTCCQTKTVWLIYNGIVSYCLIISFMLLEWIYRDVYRRKYYPDL